MGPQSEGKLVSVVMPVFNGMPYIREAVESILVQDYQNLELLILDNASTDGTRDFLQSISDPRVKVTCRTETQSVGANWTEATELASGDFVKLVCADDVVAPHALTAQVTALSENPSAAMVASRRDVVNAKGQVIKRNHGLGRLRGVVPRARAMKACMRAGTNVLGEPVSILFRREALLGALPWQDDARYLTDLATYARVLRSGSVVCLRESGGSFRISPNSWTSQIIDQQMRDFLRWRQGIVDTAEIPWSRFDAVVGNVNLKARTKFRHWYLRRA